MTAESYGDVCPLAPAQWALWASGGEQLLKRRTSVELVLPGVPGASGTVAAAVRDVLGQHEAFAVSLEVLPGVLLPVQRVADADPGPAPEVTASADAVVVRFEAPTAVLDAHSIGVLAEQLDAAARGTAPAEPELDWLDVLDWAERRAGQRGRSTSVPTELTERRADQVAPPGYEHTVLSEQTASALAAAAQTMAANAEDVLAAAVSVLVARTGGGYRPAVGRVVSGRPLAPMSAVVGRLDVLVPAPLSTGPRTARELVAAAVTAREEAQARFDADPYEVARGLVADVTDPRPWFGVATAASGRVHDLVPGGRITVSDEDPGPCPVLLSLGRTADGPQLAVRYDARLRSEPELTWLDLRIRTVLRAFADDDSRPWHRWDVVGAPERDWIDGNLTGSRAHARPAGTILDRIRRTAAEQPDTTAVVDGDEVLSYRDLLRAADDLATRLRAAAVAAESLVGLYVRGTASFVVGALGIMASGAAFLPLDPRMPAARRDRLLTIGRATVVVTDENLTDLGRTVIPLRAGAAPASAGTAVRPEGLAYAIATSGSTGEPKLVGVEHRNLAAYAEALEALVPMGSGTRVASPAAPSADLGYSTVFPALAQGATVVGIPAGARLDQAALATVLSDHRVDVLKITPSHLDALTSAGDATRCLPRAVLVLGGEVASPALLERLRDTRPELTVVNHYGPTETTVGVLAMSGPAGALGDRVPIGRPLAYTGARVAGTGDHTVPVGTPGELRISGAQVARGYLGDPRLTADRFRPAPDGTAGAREYRTGDVAVLAADGLVRYRERLDDQVKIRGFRVEPLEVQHELAGLPAVRQAVVLVDTTGGAPRLVGFVVADDAVDGLRDELRERLPEASVPAAVHRVERIPVAANGKVDRAALARLAAASAAPLVPPRNDVERVLVAIWCELIGIDDLSVEANVFECGGHSLTVTQVASRLREYLDVDVTIDVFFSHPTIAGCAEFLLARPGGAELRRRAAVVARVLAMSDEEVAAVVGDDDPGDDSAGPTDAADDDAGPTDAGDGPEGAG